MEGVITSIDIKVEYVGKERYRIQANNYGISITDRGGHNVTVEYDDVRDISKITEMIIQAVERFEQEFGKIVKTIKGDEL